MVCGKGVFAAYALEKPFERFLRIGGCSLAGQKHGADAVFELRVRLAFVKFDKTGQRLGIELCSLCFVPDGTLSFVEDPRSLICSESISAVGALEKPFERRIVVLRDGNSIGVEFAKLVGCMSMTIFSSCGVPIDSFEEISGCTQAFFIHLGDAIFLTGTWVVFVGINKGGESFTEQLRRLILIFRNRLSGGVHQRQFVFSLGVTASNCFFQPLCSF